MLSKLTATVLTTLTAASFLLTGCTMPNSANPSHEGMVYIPPTTGTMVGRWVPKSDAGAPTMAPTSGASSSSISKMQNEGMKTTPSNSSMGLGPTSR